MITDTFLQEVAKHINGETGTIPSHLAVATGSVTEINPTDTALTGEIRTRESLSSVRTVNDVSFTAISSGADVVDTSNGDAITNAGIFNASSGVSLFEGVVLTGITQTTNFDIEYDFTVQTRRV